MPLSLDRVGGKPGRVGNVFLLPTIKNDQNINMGSDVGIGGQRFAFAHPTFFNLSSI